MVDLVDDLPDVGQELLLADLQLFGVLLLPLRQLGNFDRHLIPENKLNNQKKRPITSYILRIKMWLRGTMKLQTVQKKIRLFHTTFGERQYLISP